MLELEPLRKGTKRLDLEHANLPEIGAALARRMIDGWHRWNDTFLAYHDALTEKGHSARAADTFGTLLAAADLALYDHLPDAELLSDWAAQCAPEALAEISETAEDHEACLTHLSTTTVQARGGDARETIATWLGQAVMSEMDQQDGRTRSSARARLGELGLKVVSARARAAGEDGIVRYGAVEHSTGEACYLAIAQTHRSLAEIFGQTKWQAGGWSQTLSRAPSAIRGVKVKFGKASLTAVLVPIELVLDPSDVAGFVRCPSTGEDQA